MMMLGALSYEYTTYYNYGTYRQKQKTAITEKNYNGGTDISGYNQYGQKVKVGTIKD